MCCLLYTSNSTAGEYPGTIGTRLWRGWRPQTKPSDVYKRQTDSDTIYAARLRQCDWDCGLDEEGVKANFALITNEWSYD